MFERNSKQIESELDERISDLAYIKKMRAEAMSRLNYVLHGSYPSHVIVARIDLLSEKNGQVRRLEDDILELRDELDWITSRNINGPRIEEIEH